MANIIRRQKIAERIKEILSEIFIFELTDPRLTGIFVTDVTVDRELAYAKIYVSAAEGSSRKTEVLQGLDHASGFLRRRLAQEIDLRSFPQLRFKWDSTPEKADRIEQLLASLSDDTEKSPPEGEDETE